MLDRRSVLGAFIVIAATACMPSAPNVSSNAPPSTAAEISASPSGAAPSPSAASPAVGPSASPMSQDDIRKVAANAYRRGVIPFNRTLTKITNKYSGATSLKSLRRYCAELDVALRAWIKVLQGITWPTDTAGDAKVLIRNEAANDADLRVCAKATTKLAWLQAWNLGIKANDRATEAANLVRLDLGLNPIPG
jgi:hypothetical protein